MCRIGGIGLSVGGEDPVFGQRVGYIASLSYSYNQETRRDESRASAFPGPTLMHGLPASLVAATAFGPGANRTFYMRMAWAGIELALITGRHSPIVERRAAETPAAERVRM